MKASGIACVLAMALLAPVAATVQAEDQAMFNYQGYVKVKNQPYNGTGGFKFAIISSSGNTTLWSNDGTSVDGAEPTGSISIPVSDGVFQTMVGDPTLGMKPINRVIFAIKNIKLRVWFNDGVHGFQKMTPDKILKNLDILAILTDTNDFTIYVNGATGNDENDGLTKLTAKKTINGAVEMLPPRVRCNITIDVADGVYREQVSLTGISVIAGKSILFVGDDAWTPTSVNSPSVRVTGADVDTTSTPPTAVRSYGFIVSQCAGITLKGFLCNYTLNGGFYVAESKCSIEKCQASYNGSDGGIVYTSAGFGVITDCKADHNQKYGFQIANFSGPITKGTLIAQYNGLVGFGVGKIARVSFHGAGYFSNNTKYGMLVTEGSQVLFDSHYTGRIQSNGEYGLIVQFDSFTMGHATNTITNNGVQDIYTFSGGNTYSYSTILQ